MKKAVLAAMLSLLPLCVLAQQKDVIVTDGEWKERPSTDPRQPGVTLKDKAISVDTGVVKYGIRALTALLPDGKSAAPAEGYLGMPQPGSENWYGGGFMAIRLNGQDIGGAPLKAMRVVETGERGAFDVIWDAPEAAVRVRFLAKTGDSKLFCEIALEPKGELKAVTVRANCYPSFFTAWHKQKGHRVVQSPASRGEEGKTMTLDPQKDWALVLYDTVFDGVGGHGVGPCAMLFLPDQIAAGSIRIGDYAVQSEFTVVPGAQTVRFLFWDFNGKSNADGIQCVLTDPAGYQKELREISFLNRTLTMFDFAKIKAESDAALAAAKGTEEFGKKLAEIDTKLGPMCERVREAAGSGKAIPFAMEEEALALIAQREAVQWKLKFHVLLND